jgi:hypothetical protein
MSNLHNTLLKTQISKNFGLVIAIIATTLIQARGYLRGFYYGDPFDGRLMVVLHEHWWHFLRGRRDFLDTFFFYPFDRGLGFSDTFFLQGFFYSIARYLQVDMVESWALATSAIFLLSNIGIALLAKQTIKNVYLQISLIVLTGSSFTFFVFFNMSPNVAGYGLVSYLAFFAAKLLSKESNNRGHNVGFIGIATTIPMLLLSAWYAAFFSVLFIFIYFLVSNLGDLSSARANLNSFRQIFKSIHLYIKITAISIFVFFTSLWLWIYLPVSGDVDRSIEELQAYAIKLDQLINSAALGGGVFSKIYSLLGYINPGVLIQDQNGITVSLFLAWLVLGIYFFTTTLQNKVRLSIDFKIWISLTLQFIFFLQINNFSFFQLTWEVIPALKAIRVSSRMLILVAAVLIYLVIRALDNNLKKSRVSKLSFAITPLIIVIIFLDQIRFENVTWTKENYISSDFYQAAVKAKRDCSAFYLNSEGEEWWDDQLKAMVLSARLNFPTVNGYSGGYPDNYPAQAWRSRTQLSSVVSWLSQNEALSETCLIRPNSVDKLNTDFLFNSQSGFDIMEKAGENTWWWSKSNKAQLSIINLKPVSFNGFLQGTLEIPSCQNQQTVTVTNMTTNETTAIKFNKRRMKFEIPMNVMGRSEIIFKFEALNETCQLAEDPRTLFFSLKNPVENLMWGGWGSNPGPTDYESVALTN